ncbi:RluA family pseudouridine synthase [Staphylococcus massiliensis]|uniref:Pseudouridine synthase n=1 Tax=Staphylococcus massiliensis S46 TaxID=1229783 RepID=K9ASP9_9STAP|nr:RluA family pseudouridine synthase [Staphylococcus massiliensis]EKU50393.1 ribosomal large subunit pseudouridine synthase D [Staphylococcus massiliensis S46]PNZ99751.1 RluA family pseudouridine synthase [Staphylococcus massiliensis CCUG 55927]
MAQHEFTVDSEHHLQRIDKFLPEQNDAWSRSQVQDLIKEELIKVNDKAVKSNYKIKEHDRIVVSEKETVEADILPEDLNLDIYFEDEDVAIVYKPKGMVVHPAPGHYSNTLVNGLMYQMTDLSGINGEIRPGIVHRIDKDTSGLLMVAKNDIAHRSLVDQLVDKTVTRKYVALVHGVIPHDYGTVDAPIGRNKNDRQAMAVEDDGRDAITHFDVLQRFKNYTLIECRLETGRTHQIRVHMKYIGYPLVGDPKYGPKKTMDIGGQALHAATIGFNHPKTNEYIEKIAPLPTYFEEILQDLDKGEA